MCKNGAFNRINLLPDIGGIYNCCVYVHRSSYTAKYSGVCMVDAEKASKNRWTKYEIIVITDIR